MTKPNSIPAASHSDHRTGRLPLGLPWIYRRRLDGPLEIASCERRESRAAVLRRSERRRTFLCERRRSRRIPRAIARAAHEKNGTLVL